MNSLHDLEISLVCYNAITKKACLIPVLDQNLFMFSLLKRTWSECSRLYNGESYTYLNASGIILTVEFDLQS